MRLTRKAIVPCSAIEGGLLGLALLWYWSCWVMLNSGNGLDDIPWPWLLVLAFVPLLSAALAFAMHVELRRTGRAMRAYEILLVVVAAPQFLGVIYAWRVFFYYM
jgi:hypothetical protein